MMRRASARVLAVVVLVLTLAVAPLARADDAVTPPEEHGSSLRTSHILILAAAFTAIVVVLVQAARAPAVDTRLQAATSALDRALARARWAAAGLRE